jgi:serine/threonine protein kinase
VARFQREAKTLATLNHPHIAQIFGFEVAEDLLGLAMELVEGEDLAQRLARGPFPLDDALTIARQIDDGVEHRSVRPHPDGTRFLLRRPQAANGTAQLHVIVNWPSLIKPQ